MKASLCWEAFCFRKPVGNCMEITSASLLDLNALSQLERVCFGKDAWPFLDLMMNSPSSFIAKFHW